ncbi:MAG TPA: CHAT domain-containing protein [Thermohalobaculum sp.]|nr:CHAT domain-containing protein [Thermohalobaculum sp.]
MAADRASPGEKPPAGKGAGRSPARPCGPFSLSDDEVERALRESSDAGLLEDYFGPAQTAELQRLAQQANRRSVRGKPKVLILPGIMGSKLGHEEWGPFDDVIWVDPLDIAQGRLADLSLAGGDRTIEPVGVILYAYLALKYRLRLAGFDAGFHPFDWRQSVKRLGKELAERIAAEDGQVHVVAHSMGGLVARAALEHKPDGLGRLIMLGTPNHGSFSPVQAFRGTHSVVRKVDFIDVFHSAEDLARDVFGTFPGLLEMIPAPGTFPIDLFEKASWPEGGVSPEAAMLRRARDVQAELPADYDDLTLVVGVDRETVDGAEIQDGEFVYQTSLDGDGTVPRRSALLASARKTYFIAEDHGALPNNRDVAEAVGSILATGATSVLPERYEPSRARLRFMPDRSLAVPPYAAARGRAVSLRDQRHLLEEFAAPDRTPAPLMEIEKAGHAPAAAAGAAAFADRVVIGRARQHRLEIQLASGSITEVDAQAYVLGLFRHVAPGGAARALDRLLDGAIGQMVERRMFNANIGEVSVVPTGRHPVRADVVAFAGLGPYDSFDETTLQVVGENLVRTFAATRVDEFALVPIGGGSGRFTLSALEHLLTGFFRGLRDADPEQRFRGITICENDRERFLAIRNEIYRLAATELFDGIEVTLREVELPAPAPTRGVSRLPTAEHVYLLVRQESGDGEDPVEFSASMLTTGARATIQKDRVTFADKALRDLLARLHELDRQKDLEAFGTELAGLVLPESTRALLEAFADNPLVVVHDSSASRVPWETIRIGKSFFFPSARGGMSHRYEAENLSVAKWLEQRRLGPTLDVLLVVDPTEDLPGAREEGQRVRQILEAMRPAVSLRELRGPEARRQELLNCFSSGEFDVVHYAGHAFFDERDPARSGLVCAFDEVLSGADVAALGSLPSLVFFNACEAARVRKSRRAARTRSPGATLGKRVQRSVGFAEAFLRGGVANFIGTYWPVGDRAAKAFAEAFYEQLIAGQTLHDAILTGRGAVHATGSIDWADYVLYGDPAFVLKPDAPGPGRPDGGMPGLPPGPEKRDLAPGTWVECRGPDGVPADTPVLLDMGPRTLRTGRRARVSQARHRFDLVFEGKRYRAEVLCMPSEIGDPQIITIEEPVA